MIEQLEQNAKANRDLVYSFVLDRVDTCAPESASHIK
jgi:hypothetical protein